MGSFRGERVSSSFLVISSISPSAGEKKKAISSSDILVMRKVIKIQNISKLLIRNLNDVIKREIREKMLHIHGILAHA